MSCTCDIHENLYVIFLWYNVKILSKIKIKMTWYDMIWYDMIRCDSDEAYHENERQVKDRKEKRKLYRSSRHSRDKFQERLDFKFYDFKALEVFILVSLSHYNIHLYNYISNASSFDDQNILWILASNCVDFVKCLTSNCSLSCRELWDVKA
jgi:hypothetical protein